MEGLFDPGSYRFEAASLPFLVAAGAFLVMGGYVGLMRGAPLLRASFLGISGSVLVFVLGGAAMVSARDLDVARTVLRVGLGMTTVAGASVLVFDMALARRLAQHWRLAAVGLTLATASAVVCATTSLVVDQMWITPSGVPFGTAGPLAAVHIAIIGACVFGGSAILWRSMDSESSPLRRRQLKGAMWAFSICALGVIDLALMYRIGWYPTSWLFLTVGAIVALRSLLADDLLRAVELDRRVPARLAYLALACAGAWWVTRRTDGALPAAAAIIVLFLLLRFGASVLEFFAPSRVAHDSPQQRALERYAGRTRSARSVAEIAAATEDLIGIALGAERVSFLVPSHDDWSWRRADGETLIETATPDPRLLTWLADNPRPLSRDELVAARLGDLRDPLEHLFDVHEAEAIVPLATRDDLLGLLCVGALPGGRALRPDERELLARARHHAAAGVRYANMYRETNASVEVAKEVELAAVVQEAFVPGAEIAELGPVRITGVYEPASRCGGDWWSTHALEDGRVLVLIGDVTGHGVAAAMVTAAAKGCYDVALRLMGAEVDVVTLLGLLHGSVRRAGGSEFHMTCFATLIDPATRTMTYANAGHVIPYLCRVVSNRVELDVLVERGNPLGAAEEPAGYRASTRDYRPGDLLVWYTDGLIENRNPSGQAFGDRRFQRALKEIAQRDLDVDQVRDEVVHRIATFLDGCPADDDVTLVVGRFHDARR